MMMIVNIAVEMIGIRVRIETGTGIIEGAEVKMSIIVGTTSTGDEVLLG